MIKVYAVALVLGVVALIVVIIGGSLAISLDRPERDPGRSIGLGGKMAVGGLLGFAMGGLAAEFSPLGFTWPVSLLIAVIAATGSALWVRCSMAQTEA